MPGITETVIAGERLLQGRENNRLRELALGQRAQESQAVQNRFDTQQRNLTERLSTQQQGRIQQLGLKATQEALANAGSVQEFQAIGQALHQFGAIDDDDLGVFANIDPAVFTDRAKREKALGDFSKGLEFVTRDAQGNAVLNTSVFDKDTGGSTINQTPITGTPTTKLGETPEEESTRKAEGQGRAQALKDAAKAGTESFQQLGQITQNVANIDEAIAALDNGANTGAIANLLPSVTSASIQLDNARARLGLDIIGSVTFGALSEGELQLALSTALPTNLDEPELRQWLEDKKAAQLKLKKELEKAAVFLSKGNNTVGDYLEFLQETGDFQPGGEGSEVVSFEDGTSVEFL